MQRPITCIIGLVVLIASVTLRLGLYRIFFRGFTYSPANHEVSDDFQLFRAWVDILNFAIYFGAAMSIAGWLAPSKHRPAG